MSRRFVLLAATALCFVSGYFCKVSPITDFCASSSIPPWWNREWEYRIPLYVSGNADTLRDFQLELNVNESVAPMLNWAGRCDDIRFVYFDTLLKEHVDLDFWLFDGKITHGAWYSCCPLRQYSQYHSPAATYYTNHRPSGIRFAGKHDRSYFVYGDYSRDPAIRYWDHRTRKLSDAAIVGRTQIPDDAHGNPSILIDEKGYIYIFYGCHNHPIQMRRSVYPENIRLWTEETLIPALASYPQPYKINPSTMIVSFREKILTTSGTALLSYVTSQDGGIHWSERKDILDQPHLNPYALTEVGNEQPDGSFHIAITPYYHETELYTNIYYLYSDDALRSFKKRNGKDAGIPPYTVNKLDLVHADSSWSSHVNDLILDDDNEPYILFSTGPWNAQQNAGEGEWRCAKHNGEAWHSFRIAPCDNLFDRGCITIPEDGLLKAYLPLGDDGRDGGEIAEFASYDGGETWVQQQMITYGSDYSHNYVVRVENPHPDFRILWSYGSSAPTGSDNSDTASEVYLHGDRGIIHSLQARNVSAYVEMPTLEAEGQLYMYFGNPNAACASSFPHTMRPSYDELPNGRKDPDLLVEWLMENREGTCVRDNSLYGNDGSGSFDGDEWISGGTCYERRYDISWPGFVADLHGDDFISLEQLQGDEYTDRLTIELWFCSCNPDTVLQPFANMWENDRSFYLNSSCGNLYFYTNANQTAGGMFYTQHIAKDVWHHLVAVYDGMYMELYLDGIKSPRRYAQQGQIRLGGRELILGKFEDRCFNGKMDEFRIYKRAFTEDEVTAHYKRIACCDVTAIWGLEESYADYMAAQEVRLVRAFPNPFNRHTTFNYTVPSRDIVSIDIYDVAGRLVSRIVERRMMDPGEYEASWDGRNDEGRNVASGVYFCRLAVGASSATKKFVIIR